MFGDQGRVIASITLRATMGRKRALLFAIPPVILLLVTVLLKLAHPHDPSWPSELDGIFGFTVVLPLTALIIGTSVLGAEVDEGSIVHLLATPVPRSVVIWSKYVVAAVLTATFVAVPELLAGLIATGGLTKLAVGLFAGALAGSVMYNAIFVMLSVLTTRAIAYRPGLRADLGRPARQLRQRRAAALGRALLARRCERDRARRHPEPWC